MLWRRSIKNGKHTNCVRQHDGIKQPLHHFFKRQVLALWEVNQVSELLSQQNCLGFMDGGNSGDTKSSASIFTSSMPFFATQP